MKARPLNERFWEKVRKGILPDDCWLWTSAKIPNGYGVICYLGRNVFAHRVSYEMHNGPIPEGMLMDHKCRNRLCVNPAHLRIATHAENSQNTARNSPGRLKGASFNKQAGQWVAQISFNRVPKYLGQFATELEAHDAYRRAAVELFGEFACFGGNTTADQNFYPLTSVAHEATF